MSNSESDQDSPPPPTYSRNPPPEHSSRLTAPLIDLNPPRGASGRIGSHPSSTGPHPHLYLPHAPLCTPGYEDLIMAAPVFARGLLPLLRDCCPCEMEPATNESIERVSEFSGIPLSILRRLARLGAMVETPGIRHWPPSVYFRTQALPTPEMILITNIYLNENTFYSALDAYNARHGHPRNLTGDPLDDRYY